MTIEDLSGIEAHFRRALGIDVLLEASRGAAGPREPWPGLNEETARFGDPARVASFLRGRAALVGLLARLAAERRAPEAGAAGEGPRRIPDAAALPDPAAVRFPHPFLSLTHTGDWAIAAAIRPGAARGIGVDLELRAGMREGAERFFLGAEETRWLLSMPPEARGRERVRLWTVKEALYKANPGNEGTLLGHYLLDDPAAPAGTARGRDDAGARYLYASAALDPGALSVAVTRRARA